MAGDLDTNAIYNHINFQYTYDFSVDGGAISSITLGYIPDNAYIIQAWYEVQTAFTSGGGATVAFGVAVDDAAGLKVAIAFNDVSYGLGFHDFLPNGAAANFTTLTTAKRAVIMTIAGAPLTAGVVRLWGQYGITS